MFASTLLTLAMAGPLDAAAQPLGVIPFTENGKLISMRVRVGTSRPLTFTLDSGASASVIDTGVARELAMHPYGERLGHGAGAGAVRFLLYRDVRLTAGAARWTASTMYGISLGNVGTDLREDGLVGSDFFFAYVVDIDYARHRVALYDPKRFRYAETAAAIPLTIVKHVPYVTVTIKVQGRPPAVRRLLIDTGSEDTVDEAIIGTSTARKRGVQGGTGIGSRFATYIGPIEWVRIGTLTEHNLEGATGGALIGSSVLRRFHVTFDYSRRRLYLQRR